MDAGRRFERFWAAYAASTFGTRLAFDAFALIAILVLHSGPAAVSLLAAPGRRRGRRSRCRSGRGRSTGASVR
ncbi:hypothetical protein [Actinomadura sp. CNU-125]|uniref:hypothetical protein n=1 Tax=Actinomadura sp. CNU-125 TaxID=1904961 RepID=UPI0021CD0E92|nr:hypothetical protein [Actinomadura sp. CNU-125]